MAAPTLRELEVFVEYAPDQEWYSCTWDPMERPHISPVGGNHHNGADIAQNMSEANAQLAAASVNFVRDFVSGGFRQKFMVALGQQPSLSNLSIAQRSEILSALKEALDKP